MCFKWCWMTNTYQTRFMVVCLLMVHCTLDNYIFIKSMYRFSKDDGTRLMSVRSDNRRISLRHSIRSHQMKTWNQEHRLNKTQRWLCVGWMTSSICLSSLMADLNLRVLSPTTEPACGGASLPKWLFSGIIIISPSCLSHLKQVKHWGKKKAAFFI